MEPLNLAPNISFRQATLADRSALLDICLKTGNSGNDATNSFFDPEILGSVYVAPYLEFSRDFSFTITSPDPCGYLLAALDTQTFDARLAKEYWPVLQAKYDKPEPNYMPSDLEILSMIHHPEIVPTGIVGSYPSHLHIDLLPKIQGQGIGQQVMTILFNKLKEAGSTGVHLGVGIANLRAQEFYRKLGFTELHLQGDALFMGKVLE